MLVKSAEQMFLACRILIRYFLTRIIALQGKTKVVYDGGNRL